MCKTFGNQTDYAVFYLGQEWMEEIWMIGVGQFGYVAFQRLSATGKKRHFVLVDPLGENLLSCKGPTVTHEISDGADFLETYLKSGQRLD